MSDATQSLPPEIWLRIIKHFTRHSWGTARRDNRSTLQNLVLVSSFFRDLTQPELFRSVQFLFCSQFAAANRLRLEGLADLLDRRPQAAHWIKSFDFFEIESFADLLSLLSSFFLRLPSIRAVMLHDCTITSRMLSHIYSLQRLETVTLKGDIISSESESFQAETWSTTPPITTFSLRVWDDIHPAIAKLASTPTLRNLSIIAPGAIKALVEIVEFHPAINFSDISSLSLWSTERCFSINIDPHPFFHGFASLFTNLTSLQLHTFTGAPAQDSVPQTALRHLEQFTGSLSEAMLVVPDRPIRELTVYCSHTNDIISTDLLTPFSAGTVKLQNLTLIDSTWLDGCLVDIGRLLPSLIALDFQNLRGNYLPWLPQHFANELRWLPCLQVLHLEIVMAPTGNVEGFSREQQKQILGDATPSTPCLREVKFQKVTWKIDDLGLWEIFRPWLS